MKLIEDGGVFDEMQQTLIGSLIESIKGELDSEEIDREIARSLLEKISFSIAVILDGSREAPRRFVWNLTARIHRSGARWGLWATRQSELSTNPPGGAFC